MLAPKVSLVAVRKPKRLIDAEKLDAVQSVALVRLK